MLKNSKDNRLNKVPIIEPREIYLVIIAIDTPISDKAIAIGDKKISVPKPVVIPLPPLNLI